MTVIMSLVVVVAPRTGKIRKNGLALLSKEEKFYTMVYYTLYLG